MHSSKVLRLLQALPPNELNEFGRYIDTEFFNRKKVLVSFFQFFSKYIKGRAALPDKEALYHKLFRDEAGDFRKMTADGQARHLRKRMDGLSYELKVHLEGYLVWKQSQEKGFERDILLLIAYETRQADDFYFDYAERTLHILIRETNIPFINYLYAYRLQQRIHEHPQAHRWKMDISKPQAHLDIYYICSKLVNGWVQHMQDLLVNVRTEIPMLDAALEAAKQPPFKGVLAIDCYAMALRDARNRDFSLSTSEALQARILPVLGQLSRGEQLGLFNLMVTYSVCLEQYTVKALEFGTNRFELMKFGLEKRYILRDGLISYADFYNIVSLAIAAEELEWATQFVEDYGPALRADIREPTVLLARARLKKAAGLYHEALQLLSEKTAFTGDVDKWLERIFRIKCFFEMQETDLLEHALESLRKAMTRTTGIGAALRSQTLEFVRLTRQLYRAREQNLPEVAAELASGRLSEAKIAASQTWLMQKAKEIAGID